MKKLLLLTIAALLLSPSLSQASVLGVQSGGTGAATLTGCLTGHGTGAITGTGVACGSGGGSSSVGPINTIQASDGLGGFIGTGTPQLTVGNIVGTSTNATSTFPNLSVTTAFNFLGDYITNVATWFTSRFNANFALKTTDDLTQGSTNKYFTGVTADSPLSGSGTSGSHLTISTAGTWSGNAVTATALAANGTNCSAGNYPLGVDASGNSEGCTVASTGTVTGVTATYPILSSGGAAPVISTAISTSSLIAVGTTSIASITTLANLTGYVPNARTLTINGTAFDLSADRSWTVSGGTGSGNVATSTSETAGSLAYWTSNSATPATLGKIATSTLSASSPLTGSLVQIGSGGSLGIQAASGSQNGYLGSADFSLLHTATTTFTSPLVYTQSTNAVTCSTCTTGGVTSVTASAPLFSSGGATPNITWAGLATSSQPSSSNLLVSNGGSGVYGVATSTLTASSPLTGSFTHVGSSGSLGCTTASSGVAGCLSNTAFDTFNNKQATISATWPITLTGALVGFNGLSTSTAAVSGNIPYFSGVNTFANVATTTVSCSGSTSCTSFTAIGGSPITITSSAGGGAYPFTLAGNATSTLTQFNGGLTAYASSTIGNGNQNGGLTINGGATTTGNVQIGTGSAVALVVDPTTGFVGVATSSPYSMLSVAGQVVSANYVATTTASSTFTGGIDAARVCLTGTTTCLGGSTSTGRPILSFGATSTASTFVSGRPFATTTITAGQVMLVWMAFDDQLSDTKYYLDVGNPGGGTTTLSMQQSGSTATTFDPVSMFGQYTATTTGTVFIAGDRAAGTTICTNCAAPSTMWQIF